MADGKIVVDVKEVDEEVRKLPYVTFINGDLFFYDRPCESISPIGGGLDASGYATEWIMVDFGNGEFEYHRADRVLQFGVQAEDVGDEDDE